MLNLKSLTSGIAAAALISTIGLAYAQSTSEAPANTQTPSAEQTVPATPVPADANTTSATGAADSTTPADLMTEREPKADRN